MARPRAADDFEAIRMRMNELRRERAQVSTSDEKLRTDQRQARSDGVRNLSDQVARPATARARCLGRGKDYQSLPSPRVDPDQLSLIAR